jgi:hypothetical protein
MGVFSEYDATLQEVARVMEDQPVSTQIEYRLDAIIRELDEMCGLAANPETVDLIERQRVAVGQILTRAQLVASFLMARKPGPTLIYRR